MCKVLESFIRDHIVDYMETNHLFNYNQHFRKGRSCITQLLEVIDSWTEAVDNSDCIDVIYLYFRKAFDSVHHKRLLCKFNNYKINKSIMVNWIGKFLEARQQRVLLGNSALAWTNVTGGVPQGRVLGPALFLIFTNDLPNIIESIVKLFVDDTKFFTCFKHHEQDLDSLFQWSAQWQISLIQVNVKLCILRVKSQNTCTPWIILA